MLNCCLKPKAQNYADPPESFGLRPENFYPWLCSRALCFFYGGSPIHERTAIRVVLTWVIKTNKKIKEQICFVLEDDNEVMTAALDSDLDAANKQMNRELIERHKAIIEKVEKAQPLTHEDLQLIRDANEIHLNDEDDINGHHKEAVALNGWLDKMIELTKEQAMKVLEEHLDKDSQTPAKVYKALHILWEEATPDDVVKEPAFDKNGRCKKCGSRVSFADVTDTVVFVSDEIVKRHNGNITNRNCVRSNYPERYGEYEHYDKEAS